jgi:hypothetical protein
VLLEDGVKRMGVVPWTSVIPAQDGAGFACGQGSLLEGGFLGVSQAPAIL